MDFDGVLNQLHAAHYFLKERKENIYIYNVKRERINREKKKEIYHFLWYI